MGQEYFINSQDLENKIRQLLPSQGGAGAGFDLSASTQIIPVIDVTESAEGSEVRSDLQLALSHKTITFTPSISNTQTTIINNTGYYEVLATASMTGAGSADFSLFDGATEKIITRVFGAASVSFIKQFKFVVFIPAGGSCLARSTANPINIDVTTRQIADIDGNLTDPT